MRDEIRERIEMIHNGDIPEGYKVTKAGISPKEWQVMSLRQLIVDGIISNGIFNEPEKKGSGTKLINVVNLYSETNIKIDELEQLEVTDEDKKKFEVRKYEILCTRSSIKKEGIGKCNIYIDDEEVVYDCHIMKFTPNNKLINEFYLNYLLNYIAARKQFIVRSKTTTMTTIGQSDIAEIVLNVPSLPEQLFNMNILRKYDGKIELMQSLIDEKERRRNWIMQNLLTGKKRIQGYKEKWEENRLGKLFAERNETKGTECELLSITGTGIIPRSNLEGKDNSSEDKSKYKKIYVGDIGYNTMRMWQGVSAYSKYEGIVSPAYTVLKPKENADAKFFSYLFKLPSVVFKFYRYSQGLVDDTRNLKYENFKKIKLFIPTDKEEQKAIAMILSYADKELELLQQQLEQIKLEKKAIMQLLLTGIVRVNQKGGE